MKFGFFGCCFEFDSDLVGFEGRLVLGDDGFGCAVGGGKGGVVGGEEGKVGRREG